MNEKSLFVKGELIGRNVKISKSTDPSWIGREGRIIDETKNTFILETEDGLEKMIAKEIATFEFDVNGKKFFIDGLNLRYRPEDRIKKAR